MSTIRLVRGSATAPTEMASYDAALAQAGVENYNLVSVSSVIPAAVPLEVTETAPDLGPPGERLTVVEGCATGRGPVELSAAIAWARSVDDGPGLFYEVADSTDPDDVERRVRAGLEAGCELRDWAFDDPEVLVEHIRVPADTYGTAVVLATYGESEPIV